MGIGWACSSLSVMFNGFLRSSFHHGRRLRQSNPLSPLLFILVIDPDRPFLDLEWSRGIFNPLSSNPTKLRLSLYADDVDIFTSLVKSELEEIR